MNYVAVFAFLFTSAVLGATSDPQTREVAPKPTTTVQEQPVAPPPAITPVLVTNFPATQGVAGIVAVSNLPAVQEVIGEVTISNLPAPCSEPAYLVLQVPAIPGPTQACGEPCRYYTSAPFSTAGWKVLSAQIVIDNSTDPELGAAGAIESAVRNFPTDPFAKWVGLDNAGSGPVRGAEAIVKSIVLVDAHTVSHFSIYLSR